MSRRFMVGWQCSWRSLGDMATNNPSGYGDGDFVLPEQLARVRVNAWSRLNKHGAPIRLPALSRTCMQVLYLHVGMLDRKQPAGPLTGESGFGPTQQSIATIAKICVGSVKLAERWLSDPITQRVAVTHEVKQRGKPTIKVQVMQDVPVDPRGRPGPGGTRVPWTEADGLRKWPTYIQVFDAEKISGGGGGGGRRRRICVHPLFYLASPEAFKACTELPPWAVIDITEYDIGSPERHEPTRDELMEMFYRDNELGLKNGELSSPFQSDHHLGETDE